MPINLKDVMPPRAYEAMMMEKAMRAHQSTGDDSADAHHLYLVRQAERVKEYRDFPGGAWAGYCYYKELIGNDYDQTARFEQAGIILQPKQLEFAFWARKCDEPDGPEEVGMGGAKGGGKTLALMVQSALDDMERWPGLKALFMRFTARSAKEQMSDLSIKVFSRRKDIVVTKEKIEHPNGSYMLIGGFNNDRQAMNYAGIENDILIVEEATQLSSKTHEVLRGTNRSSRERNGVLWRPRRYFSANPLGVGHSFFKGRFIDNERRRAKQEDEIARNGSSLIKVNPAEKFIFAKIEDNSFVNPEYVNVLNSYSGAQYQAYRLGNWDVSAGAYFSSFSFEYHVKPDLTSLEGVKRVWASMDFGFNHWNVCHLHADIGDGVYKTFDELAHRQKHPEEIGPDMLTWLAKYGLEPKDLDHWLTGSDSFASNGRSQYTVVQQYRSWGIIMSRAENRPGSRVAGAITLAKMLGAPERNIPAKWLICECCDKLKECMAYLEIDPNNPEDVMKLDTDEEGRGGDDAYDSARYGIYAPQITVLARPRSQGVASGAT